MASDQMSETSELAGTWCLRLSEGCLSGQEQADFDRWLAESPDNLAAFERSVAVWQCYGEAATSPEFIEVRERALATYRRLNQKRWASQTGWSWITAFAASLVLILAVTLWLRAGPDVYETGIGERRVVMLEDGSRASLDAVTRLEARMRGDRRELELLSGRAKFDVSRDPLRPFSVRVANRLVVATGTSFSVEVVNRRMHVVLYEGRVAVLDAAANGGMPAPLRVERTALPAEQVLRPGGELVADLARPVATVAPTDLPRSLSWEAGRLVFVDEPLGLAVGRVNRYAHRPIVLQGAVDRLVVNGVFDTGDTEAFLIGVEETLPARVERTDDRVLIRPR